MDDHDLDVGGDDGAYHGSNFRERSEWHQKVAMMGDEGVLSSRVETTISLLRTILAGYPGEKILIFSRFKKFLDLIDRAIELSLQMKCACFRFEGTIS